MGRKIVFVGGTVVTMVAIITQLLPYTSQA
jgi:hypothetical protein